MVRSVCKAIPIFAALCAANLNAGSINISNGNDCIGFATIDGSGNQTLEGGVTGGAEGAIYQVTTYDELVTYCSLKEFATLVLEGTITIPIN